MLNAWIKGERDSVFSKGTLAYQQVQNLFLEKTFAWPCQGSVGPSCPLTCTAPFHLRNGLLSEFGGTAGAGTLASSFAVLAILIVVFIKACTEMQRCQVHEMRICITKGVSFGAKSLMVEYA